MNKKTEKIKRPSLSATLTKTAFCTGLIIVAAQVSIPLPVSAVPVTLQTFAIMLFAVILPPSEGLFTVGLYTFMGILGLPVFASFRGGPNVLFGATGGFIIGFLPAVFLMSVIVSKQSYIRLITGMMLFSAVLYSFGLIWFMILTGITLKQALLFCILPFLPGDAIKTFLLTVIYPRIKDFQKIL